MAKRKPHKPPGGSKPTNLPGVYRVPSPKVAGKREQRLGKPYFNSATGERLTRRQYLSALRGGISNEQYARSRPPSPAALKARSIYEAGLEMFRTTQEIETGKRMGRRESQRAFREINAGLRSWSYKTVNGRRVPITRDEAIRLSHLGKGPLRAGGPIARALEAMGRRRPDSPYPVGETPD